MEGTVTIIVGVKLKVIKILGKEFKVYGFFSAVFAK